MALFWSEGLLVRSARGRTCFFNRLTADYTVADGIFTPAAGSALTKEEEDALSPALFAALEKAGLLCPSPSGPSAAPEDAPCLEHINFLVTDGCNLGCTYCQIEKNLTAGRVQDLSVSDAKAALDRLKAFVPEDARVTVNLTGGEPLVNFETVNFLLGYASECFGSLRFSLFTNGTLLDSRIARILKEYNVLTIVSLDGPEEIHDKRRRDLGGQGSYARSLEGYRTAQAEGCSCALSSVACEETLSDIDTFADWAISLRPLSLGYNYPHLLLGHPGGTFEVSRYTAAILALHRKMQGHGIYLENYERFRRAVAAKRVRRRECQACGRGITVRADGKFGPCKSLLVSDRIVLCPETFDYSSDETVQSWAARTPLSKAECRKCDALAICGGGCAYDAYILHGDPIAFDERLCPHFRAIMDEILYDLCIRGGTDGGDPLFGTVGH